MSFVIKKLFKFKIFEKQKQKKINEKAKKKKDKLNEIEKK
jgi:hypothetical protein